MGIRTKRARGQEQEWLVAGGLLEDDVVQRELLDEQRDEDGALDLVPRSTEIEVQYGVLPRPRVYRAVAPSTPYWGGVRRDGPLFVYDYVHVRMQRGGQGAAEILLKY